jgi:flagellar biosynthetic protein FliQ
MSIGEVTMLLRGGIFQVLTLAMTLLLPALMVGLIVAVLQATTSIQEQTLTFVPKVFVILLILALLGGMGFSRLADYTTQLFMRIPDMVR